MAWIALAVPSRRRSRAAEDSPGSAGDIDSGVNLDQLMNLRVVTASGGVEEEGSMAPASVVVFTRDDIARQGWRSLTDVLANTPGLDVNDDGVMPSVGVRGVTGGIRASTRIVKVMIDGIAVNFRPDLAALIGPEFIPIEAIDRVEIAKGPLSAIYGANAFLAVVNVITVRAPNVPMAAVNLRSNLMRQGPGYGASAFVAESSSSLEIVAAFSTDRADRSGLRITKTLPNQDVTLPRYAPFFASASQNDVTEPRSAFLSLRLPGTSRSGSLALEGGVQQLDSMGEFQLNSVLTHRSRIAIDNYWSQARYEKSWSDRMRLVATAGYSTGAPTRDEALYLTDNFLSSFTPRYRYDAVDAGFQLAYTPARRFSLVIGADGSYEPQRTLYYTQTFQSMQGTNAPGDSIDLIGANDQKNVVLANAGAYAQMAAVPFARLPNLHLTVSGRLDVPNLFSGAVQLAHGRRLSRVARADREDLRGARLPGAVGGAALRALGLRRLQQRHRQPHRAGIDAAAPAGRQQRRGRGQRGAGPRAAARERRLLPADPRSHRLRAGGRRLHRAQPGQQPERRRRAVAARALSPRSARTPRWRRSARW